VKFGLLLKQRTKIVSLVLGVNTCILTILWVKQIVPCNFNHALHNRLQKSVELLGSCGRYNLLYYWSVTQLGK
jgi:hypothetical protein